MFSKRNYLTILSIVFLSFSSLIQSENVIFDLGGVLFETKTMNAINKLGLFNLVMYAGNPRKPFFKYLDSIKPRAENAPVSCDESGNLLPQLMCDWMTGALPCKEIAQLVHHKLDNDKTLGTAEYNIFHNLATMMFGDQESFIQTKRIIPAGLEFAQQCKNEGHKLYIISNWDAESYALVKKAYPELFALFDGEIISGQVGLLKPEPAIYKLCLEKFNLNPKESVFIDDQLENLIAAQEQGIKGIICEQSGTIFNKTTNFWQVKMHFKHWLNPRFAPKELLPTVVPELITEG